MRRLIWMFHGPRAQGIGDHHAKHLREFAAREGLDDATVECSPAEAGGIEVVMTVADDVAERVAKALRPRRVE